MKRIQREVSCLRSFINPSLSSNFKMRDVQKEDLGEITVQPTDNMFKWTASIPGPEGSVYEGGLFHLNITLPQDYP